VTHAYKFKACDTFNSLKKESPLNQAAALRPSGTPPVQADAWASSVAKRLSDKSLHCRLTLLL
jgi:hypothetical protein